MTLGGSWMSGGFGEGCFSAVESARLVDGRGTPRRLFKEIWGQTTVIEIWGQTTQLRLRRETRTAWGQTTPMPGRPCAARPDFTLSQPSGGGREQNLCGSRRAGTHGPCEHDVIFSPESEVPLPLCGFSP